MSDPQDPFAAPPPDAPPPQPATPSPAPPYGAPSYAGAPPYGAPLPATGVRNGMGTAALVLGLVAIVPCSWMVLIPAVLAIVFGFVGRGRVKRGEATNRGAATTGIVLGAVSLLLGVVVWGFLLANIDAFNRLNDCTDAANGNSTLEDQCAKDFVKDVFGVTVT